MFVAQLSLSNKIGEKQLNIIHKTPENTFKTLTENIHDDCHVMYYIKIGMPYLKIVSCCSAIHLRGLRYNVRLCGAHSQVYYSRDEVEAEAAMAKTNVCISSAEYYGLLATMVVLMVMMMLAALLAGLWCRRSRLIAYKNQDADATSPLPRGFSPIGAAKNTFSFLHGKP